jgi:hypothetical protein
MEGRRAWAASAGFPNLRWHTPRGLLKKNYKLKIEEGEGKGEEGGGRERREKGRRRALLVIAGFSEPPMVYTTRPM